MPADPEQTRTRLTLDMPSPPSWADERRVTVTIGRHRFYRL